MFSDNEVDNILGQATVARLAQIDLDGHPQALPFVFAFCANALWSPIDGKPKKNARLSRLDWLRRHPEVLVLIDHYADDWQCLWWLKLYCAAEIVNEEHVDWSHARAALAVKYPQYETTPMFLGEPTMIRLSVLRRKSWSASGGVPREAS